MSRGSKLSLTSTQPRFEALKSRVSGNFRKRPPLDLKAFTPPSPSHSDFPRIAYKLHKFQDSLTLKAKEKVQIRRLEGKDVYDFGLGETKGQLLDSIRQAGIQAFEEGQTGYEHPAGLLALRQKIPSWLGVDNHYGAQNVVVTVGAKQSIFNTFMAICNPGDIALLDSAPWVSYIPLVQCAGAVPISVKPRDPSNGLKITAEDLQEALQNQPSTRLFLLNSPCNPTGQVYTQEELDSLVDVCVQNRVYFVLDRIYWKITFEHDTLPSPKITPESKAWIVQIDGFSKNFRSCGGLRVGWTVAPEDLTDAMINIQSHCTSGAATPAQHAALAALSVEPYNDEMIKDLKRKRSLLSEHSKNMPNATIIPTAGAYYSFWDISECFGKITPDGHEICGSQDLVDYILDSYGVVAVAGAGFDQEGYIRLSFHIDDQVIIDGMAAMREALGSLV